MRNKLEYQADRIEAVLSMHKVPARVTGGTVDLEDQVAERGAGRRPRCTQLPSVATRGGGGRRGAA